jgi:hypothetical protein
MNKTEKIYVTPEMEIVNIEVEQSILTVSTERLGTWHEEQEW